MDASPLYRLTNTLPSRKSFSLLLLNILLFIFLMYQLPFDQKANTGLALMVFFAVLWLTECIHITITALLIPVMAVFFNLLDVKNALKSFAHPIIFLFFGGFALATALRIQGLDRLIANRLLLLARGKMSVAALILFVMTALLSMWISNTSTAVMMMSLALGILSNLDPKKEQNTYIFLLLGVAYSASIGGLGTLVGSPPNAIAAAQLGIDFFTWMKWGVPLIMLMMPLMIGVLYFSLRPNLQHKVEIKTEKINYTLPRLFALLIFFLTIFSWIFSAQISALLGGIKQFDALVAISAAVLISVSGVATWSQIEQNTEWGVLILFGGGLTLSIILKDSGASTILAQEVIDLFGKNGQVMMVFAVTVFIIFLTEFTSNTATAALLVPVFSSLGPVLGMPEALLTLIIGFGASCAFMLPVATPPNAIVFGTGYVPQGKMVNIGMWLNILSVLVIGSFALFFWR